MKLDLPPAAPHQRPALAPSIHIQLGMGHLASTPCMFCVICCHNGLSWGSNHGRSGV